MRPATLAPANITSSAANTVAENVPVDGGKPGGGEKTIKATQAGGNLEVSRNQAAKISTSNISTPSKGLWSLVDECLAPLERMSSAIQGKH